MKRLLHSALILSFLITLTFAELPKFEFRGAWIATVANLDWPSSPYLTVESQKAQLVNLLDKLQSAGINAVVFQVRPECDALYNSSIEPWSYWLTGQQGRAPSPFYDPLAFAIEETHKRGMELHAWFNPYRAVKTVGAYPVASNHVSVVHPDWIITKGSLKILNPGLPDVREYVISVIRDVVERYAIDGVHFDDYFYPYEGMSNEDSATFANYSRGFTNIEDWRRDNVNLFVAQVYQMIQQVNPRVKFGISPFGIWKSGVPDGITGMSAYSAIYCDALAWLQAGTVDYLAPQCYWKIGGGQDYSKLVPWWAQQTSQANRHLYVGQIFNSNYSNTELQNQVAINRATDGVQGNILFRATHISNNTFSFADYLRNVFHKYPAITPAMSWRDSVPPKPPRDLAYQKIAPATAGLSWYYPETAADGDSAKCFVLYRFHDDNISLSDLANPANIQAIVYSNQFVPAVPDSQGPYYYVLTALDYFSNESQNYAAIAVAPPEPPAPEFPENYAQNVRDTVYLRWRPRSLDSEYELIYSSDSLLSSGKTVVASHLTDTVQMITGLKGQQTYYWKVKAFNAGGNSNYSDLFQFTTAFPTVPALLFPAHATTGVSIMPVLTWQAVPTAQYYHLQVAKSLDFNAASIILDNAAIGDTAISIGPLEYNRAYFWRVEAINDYGASGWSSSFRFKTIPAEGIVEVTGMPDQHALRANYPNPFNAWTTIEFDLPQAERALLKVYDLNGSLVRILVDDFLSCGTYKVLFDAVNLPSGFYFYQLQVGRYEQTRKMVLIK